MSLKRKTVSDSTKISKASLSSSASKMKCDWSLSIDCIISQSQSFFGEGAALHNSLGKWEEAGYPIVSYRLYSLLLAHLVNYLQDIGKHCQVCGWEEVVGSVDVETSHQQVWEESFYPHVSVCSTVNGMLSEVLYPFSSLSPSFPNSVSTKQDPIEEESEDCVHEYMQL